MQVTKTSGKFRQLLKSSENFSEDLRTSGKLPKIKENLNFEGEKCNQDNIHQITEIPFSG